MCLDFLKKKKKKKKKKKEKKKKKKARYLYNKFDFLWSNDTISIGS
jgi:hypothetical protein